MTYSLDVTCSCLSFNPDILQQFINSSSVCRNSSISDNPESENIKISNFVHFLQVLMRMPEIYADSVG
jgi:hypothetical protein